MPYLAAFEQSGVSNAERAFWHEYGTVDGLVTVSGVNGTTTNQPTGTWWLYKWYGDMTGAMVAVTPPAGSALDGVASYDPLSKTADILVDGSGTTNVTVTGISGLGSSVTAQVESTSTANRFAAVTAPTVLSQQTLPVSGGQLTVQIPSMTASHAYRCCSGRPTAAAPSGSTMPRTPACITPASWPVPPRRMATTSVA